MNATPHRVLFVFLDGVGIGEDDARTNPFATALLPNLRRLLGGCLPFRTPGNGEGRIEGDASILIPTDATLGVEGLPQSGTGQTALLTGANAPAMFGRHFGSWVPVALRGMLERDNLLSRAARAGRTVQFANAVPPFAAADGSGRRPAAPPLAARGAGLEIRGADELRAGRAVASSITNERWQKLVGGSIPTVSAAAAGRNLARLATEAELTLFAHYDTDFVGHRGDLAAAVAVLERVDTFLGGVLDDLPSDILLLIASDHGNIENATGGHTRNPVPVIAAGPGHLQVAAVVHSLTDVAPILRKLLRIPDS